MFGNISLKRRLRVVLPLEEHPLIPTTTALRGAAIMVYVCEEVELSRRWMFLVRVLLGLTFSLKASPFPVGKYRWRLDVMYLVICFNICAVH